jgi:hypothetical protein
MDVQIDLVRALTDVRKAYRLIWLYQRRVVDIIRLISESLGYRFWRWETEYHIGRMPGQVTRNPFEEGEWIWATLPLYRMSLFYFPSTLDWNVQKSGQWMLEIAVETDTGVTWPEDGSEPSPVEFAAADKCETLLRLYAWYCTKEGNLDWFRGVWHQILYPEQDDEPTAENVNVPVRIIRKSLDLSKLPDRASVERALTEFREAIVQKMSSAAPDKLSEPITTSIRLRG